MSISFHPGISKDIWDQNIIKVKLTNLASAEKSRNWIQLDLSTPKSSFLGRCFWKIAKHFQCLRNALYGVNIPASKTILERIWNHISEDTELVTLFNRAVRNFESITGKQIKVPGELFSEMIARQTPPAPSAPLAEQPPTSSEPPAPNPVTIVSEPVQLPPSTPTVVFDRPVPVYIPQPTVIIEEVPVPMPMYISLDPVYPHYPHQHRVRTAASPVFVNPGVSRLEGKESFVPARARSAAPMQRHAPLEMKRVSHFAPSRESRPPLTSSGRQIPNTGSFRSESRPAPRAAPAPHATRAPTMPSRGNVIPGRR